jgi:hypothetical protein
MGMVVEEVVMMEVVGELTEWTVEGPVGNGAAFDLPPPQATTT